jgi:SAM-dependent methyltransferase
MLMALNINWSSLYAARNEIKTSFPSIWKLPLVKKEMSLIQRLLKPKIKVLEIGAGDRRMEKKIKKIYSCIIYKSFDIDKATYQDFYDLKEIQGNFDLIFGFELIEHLTPHEGLQMITTLRNHLNSDGSLVLGTPNLYHPHRYFGDLTHITPYKYEELGALMILGGYKVIGFYRQFNDAFLPRILRLYFFSWLHKWLDIDFASTILVQSTPVLTADHNAEIGILEVTPIQ